MKTFIVSCCRTVFYQIEVEADSEMEVKKQGIEEIERYSNEYIETTDEFRSIEVIETTQ